ncbi:BON domain-containing protein [Variovorax ureilyticus]|uniref:BON domain-containing protein n=1 Tax=Variovorax ureilyticus TaxID=1836198 RepID=UPI003D679357
MRSDAQLRSDVQAELDWDPAINSTQIGVIAADGIVTLTGHVASHAEKHAAEAAARRVRGSRHSRSKSPSSCPSTIRGPTPTSPSRPNAALNGRRSCRPPRSSRRSRTAGSP